MIKIIDIIDIIIDFPISDDVNAGFNDVKTVTSINDVNIVTNANNDHFYWVNYITYFKDINNILDPHDSDDVKNVNDFCHCYQTRQLAELINGSYDRGRLQVQYLFWLLVTKMAAS